MKAKSLFMPLLISVAGLTACSMLTPHSSVSTTSEDSATKDSSITSSTIENPTTASSASTSLITNSSTTSEPMVVKDTVKVSSNIQSSDILLYGAGTYNRGYNATVYSALKQNAFYVFKDWSVNSEVVSTDKYYNFSTSGDVEVVGRFLEYTAIGNYLAFTTSYQPGDSSLVITVSIDSNAPQGSYIVPTAVTVKNNDGTALNHTYKINDSTATITIDVSKINQKFAITGVARGNFDVVVNANVGSTIALTSTGGKYAEGQNLHLTTTLSDGGKPYYHSSKIFFAYVFSGWNKNSTSIGGPTEPTMDVSVTGNDTYTAIYTQFAIQRGDSGSLSSNTLTNFNYNVGNEYFKFKYTLGCPGGPTGSTQYKVKVECQINGNKVVQSDAVESYDRLSGSGSYYNSAANIKIKVANIKGSVFLSLEEVART